MRHTVAALAAIIAVFSAGTAEARWTVQIYNEVPVYRGAARTAPRYATWAYVITDRNCWDVTGADNSHAAGGWPGQKNSVEGPRESSRTSEQTILTDTKGCGKMNMNVNVYWMTIGGQHAVSRTYHFTASGGGLFSDFRYFLEGREYAKRYWDDAHLCTTIRVRGDNTDDVSTRSGDC